jgi:hypothetical protein
MTPLRQRQGTPGLLLSVALLGSVLYLSGLSATLQLGDANRPGLLLIPALPTPLYIVMAVVVLSAVVFTLLASIHQRRRRASAATPTQDEVVRTPWQVFVSTLASLTLLLVGVVWLWRHGPEVHQFLARLREQVNFAHELLEASTQAFVQVHSPTTGYTMFTVVILVYGGLGLLGLWALCDGWGRVRWQDSQEEARPRQVQRAVAAGLQALRVHTDPRQAIIACYARLEHLLEDYGVPAYGHLTPQEYMGAALRGLDLPAEALAGLVALFELARYSLHPLDDTARATAIAHLEQLNTHLERNQTHAVHA